MELPLIMEDNLQSFFRFMQVAILHADPQAEIDIKRSSNGYMVTISPNVKDFRQETVQNILYIGRHLKTPIKFSSSLGISRLISFELLVPEVLN